jgi:hypothetical protein
MGGNEDRFSRAVTAVGEKRLSNSGAEKSDDVQALFSTESRNVNASVGK